MSTVDEYPRSQRPFHTTAILRLRSRFIKELDNPKILKSDLDRIFNETWWLNAFLASCNGDTDVAYAVIMECLKWRSSVNINRISLLELKPLLERRVAYLHGHDIQGSALLWINMAEHRSGDRDIDKLLAYWMERHYMERKAAPLAVLFDMNRSGLRNMDVELVKFLVHSFKYYYPKCLSAILIFGSPSVLSAAWTLTRSWMDPQVQRMVQHVSTNSISAFIDSQFLPPHMGGQDDFVFTMDELAKCLPSQSMNGDVAANASVPNGDTHEANINTHIIDLSSKRSVKFEGDGDTTATATTVKIAPRSSSLSRRGSMIPNSLRPLAETRAAAPDDECFISNSLRISPKDELVLCQVEGENDWVDIVVLENRGSKTIVYKVKTTSREKFRVRPTTGSIAPGSTEFVRVYLQNEYKNQFGRDRFLLLAVEVDDPNSGEFSTLWKDAADSAKVERKLQCRIANSPRRTSSASCSSMPPIKKAESDEQTLSVRQDMLSLLWQQRILFICFAVLFVFHFQALIFQRSYYNYLIEKIQNVKCDCQCPAAPPSPSSPNINDYHSEL